jgi:hypothetical protein
MTGKLTVAPPGGGVEVCEPIFPLLFGNNDDYFYAGFFLPLGRLGPVINLQHFSFRASVQLTEAK